LKYIYYLLQERAQELFKELLYDGIHVDVIHSDRYAVRKIFFEEILIKIFKRIFSDLSNKEKILYAHLG